MMKKNKIQLIEHFLLTLTFKEPNTTYDYIYVWISINLRENAIKIKWGRKIRGNSVNSQKKKSLNKQGIRRGGISG